MTRDCRREGLQKSSCLLRLCCRPRFLVHTRWRPLAPTPPPPPPLLFPQVDHPNIIHMYDFYEEQEHFYLVMEVMSGGEVRVGGALALLARRARRELWVST